MQRRCQRAPCEGRLLGSAGFAGRPGKTHHTIMKSYSSFILPDCSQVVGLYGCDRSKKDDEEEEVRKRGVNGE